MKTMTHTRRLSLERLERRITPSVNLSNGVLVLTGSEAADRFEIYAVTEPELFDLVVDQYSDGELIAHEVFNGFDVSSAAFFGLGGNDTLFNNTGLRTEAWGSTGDDHIETPGELHGGEGNDVLLGTGAGDELYGDDGNDILTATYGSNRLYGGNGDDIMTGSDSEFWSDEFGSGIAGDWMEGGPDQDVMHGRKGDDQMYGGDGVDTVHGDEGDDLVDGGAGEFDRLFGDAGADEFRADWLARLPVNLDNPEDFNAAEGDTISPEWEGSDLLPLEPFPFGIVDDALGLTIGGSSGSPGLIPAAGQADLPRQRALDAVFATPANIAGDIVDYRPPRGEGPAPAPGPFATPWDLTSASVQLEGLQQGALDSVLAMRPHWRRRANACSRAL